MSTAPIRQNVPAATTEPPVSQDQGFLRGFFARPEFGPLILLSVLIVFFSLRTDTFVSTGNISNLLTFTPEMGMIALAMTVLITSGEFDLSVGAVFGVSQVILWTLFKEGASFEVAFLVAMFISLIIGLVNGLFVTLLGVPSFLVTLGMMMVARGAAFYIDSLFSHNLYRAENTLTELLAGTFYVGDVRIYASLIWFALFAVLLGFLLTQSRIGNWVQAAGGNPQAARARGVRVTSTKVLLFVITAMMSAFAGIISSIRVSSMSPNSGTGYELEVIAMVVIGGTALNGGRGTIIGTVLGVFILRIMRNGTVMIGVPGLAYNIFIGGIILAMMALHSALERRHGARD